MKLKKYSLSKFYKTFIIFLITITIFISLTKIVISGRLNTTDLTLVEWIHFYQHPILTRIAKIFYFLGESEVAALVVISNVKGSPAVCRVKTESVSTIPPELAEVCVIFSPDHLFNADPYFVIVISSTISWVVVVVEFIEPWVN